MVSNPGIQELGPHRRNRGRWLAGASVAVVLGALLIPWSLPSGGRLGPAAGAALHAGLFAGLAWIVQRSVPEARRGWPVWGLLTALSAAVEWLQPFVGRSAELADWLYGTGGAACICAAGHVRARFRWGGVLVLGLMPLVWELVLFGMEVRAYPALADSGMKWSRRGWVLNSVRLAPEPSSGLRLAAVPDAESAATESYPGLFRAPAVSDWRGARALQAELFWPDPHPVVFAIRVDDRPGNPAYADRFQREFPATQGWNRLRIPIEDLGKTSGGRKMELERIRQWGVFLVSDVSMDYFLLGAVRVELPEERP